MNDTGSVILKLISLYLIPSANMPLFTFLSGIVFAMLMRKGHYNSLGEFTKKKFKRLVIPFLVLGTIISYTSVNADFAHMGFSWLCYGQGSHMWYVIMLFWIFIVAWILQTYRLWIINIVLTIISFLYPFMDLWGVEIEMLPWGLHNSLHYYCYFAVAIFLYDFISKNKPSLIKTLVFFLILDVAIFGSMLLTRNNQLLYTLFLALRNISFLISIFFFFTYLTEKGIFKDNRYVMSLSKYSFGIYVIHHWIGWDLYHVNIIIEWLNQSYYVVAFLITAIVFVVSYIFTKYTLKTKIGQYLLV